MYSLMVTAKMNNIDPRTWLADVLGRIGDHPASRLDNLLPRTGTPSAHSQPEFTTPRLSPDGYDATRNYSVVAR